MATVSRPTWRSEHRSAGWPVVITHQSNRVNPQQQARGADGFVCDRVENMRVAECEAEGLDFVRVLI